MQGSPVFLVGSVRTGSTALVSALLAAGLVGHREGHLHLVFPDLLEAAAAFYRRRWQFAVPGTLLHDTPEPLFRAALLDFVRAYVAGCYGGQRWLEKTVNLESLKAVPVYREIWPQADFVFIRRHPAAILASRMVKFPQHSFQYHCRDLAEIHRTWFRLRADLPRYLELDQTLMERAPAAAAQTVGAHLGLFAPEVRAIADALAAQRPEKTQDPLSRAALFAGDNLACYLAEFEPLQGPGGFVASEGLA